MFSPNVYLKIILNAAYNTGRDFAYTIHNITEAPPTQQELDKARDQLADTVAKSLRIVPAFDSQVLVQGVYASAFSGFMDRTKQISEELLAKVLKDHESILDEVDEQLRSKKPEGFDTGLFTKDAEPPAAGAKSFVSSRKKKPN